MHKQYSVLVYLCDELNWPLSRNRVWQVKIMILLHFSAVKPHIKFSNKKYSSGHSLSMLVLWRTLTVIRLEIIAVVKGFPENPWVISFIVSRFTRQCFFFNKVTV